MSEECQVGITRIKAIFACQIRDHLAGSAHEKGLLQQPFYRLANREIPIKHGGCMRL